MSPEWNRTGAGKLSASRSLRTFPSRTSSLSIFLLLSSKAVFPWKHKYHLYWKKKWRLPRQVSYNTGPCTRLQNTYSAHLQYLIITDWNVDVMFARVKQFEILQHALVVSFRAESIRQLLSKHYTQTLRQKWMLLFGNCHLLHPSILFCSCRSTCHINRLGHKVARNVFSFSIFPIPLDGKL